MWLTFFFLLCLPACDWLSLSCRKREGRNRGKEEEIFVPSVKRDEGGSSIGALIYGMTWGCYYYPSFAVTAVCRMGSSFVPLFYLLAHSLVSPCFIGIRKIKNVPWVRIEWGMHGVSKKRCCDLHLSSVITYFVTWQKAANRQSLCMWLQMSCRSAGTGTHLSPHTHTRKAFFFCRDEERLKELNYCAERNTVTAHDKTRAFHTFSPFSHFLCCWKLHK